MQITKGNSAGNDSKYLFQSEKFNFQIDEGKIRYISSGGEELLRMIHLAVRDENWMTIKYRISDFQLDVHSDFASINYRADFVSETIDFTALVNIVIKKTEISFSFRGKANKDFLRNRIGICVLHPLKASKNCIVNIERPDGRFYSGVFPEKIQPDQPFKNIRSMKWSSPAGTTLELEFKGDTFETEDQRNWGDASFKTYGTPVDLPFPVLIDAGTEIEQAVKFNFSVSKKEADRTDFFLVEEASTKFPEIGLSIPVSVPTRSTTVPFLQDLFFDYLSLEIHFSDNWQSKLDGTIELARDLRKEIRLILIVENTASIPEEFYAIVTGSGVKIGSILLLANDEKIISKELFESHSSKLRLAFDGIPIGAGTGFHFAEINRFRLQFANADFIAFPVNPQVHADDNATITENLEVYPEMTDAAHQLYPSIPVKINRLTLRYPFNPDPDDTDRYKRDDGLPWIVDERQWQMFYALWILPAIEKLSNAKQITICDTNGYQGLFSEFFAEGMPESGNNFWLFPAYLIFLELGHFKPIKFYRAVSGNPLQISGVCMHNKDGRNMLILSNFSSEIQEIDLLLPDKFPSYQEEKVMSIDNLKEISANYKSWAGDKYLPVPAKGVKQIRIRPFACHFYR